MHSVDVLSCHFRYFRQAIQGRCHALFEAALAFTECLTDDRKGRELILQRIGVVWERADSLVRESNAVTNPVLSCLNIISGETGLIEDAVQELEEAFREATADQEFDDQDPMTWSSNELKVLPHAIGIIKTIKALLKKVHANMRQHGRFESAEEIRALDETAGLCQRMSPLVDDVTEAFYPPIDAVEVEERIGELKKAFREVLDGLGSAYFVPASEYAHWGPFLQKAFDHNESSVRQRLVEIQLASVQIQ